MSVKDDLQLHYNDEIKMYEHFLGPSMSYTCADFENLPEDASLEQGQKNKFEKLTRFAGVNSKTKRVLDLGCGWGSLQRYLHSNFYDIESTGVSLCSNQIEYCRKENRSDKSNFIEEDIFDVISRKNRKNYYDSAFIVGVLEHFATYRMYKSGEHIERYRQFFTALRNCTKEGVALQSLVTMRPTAKMPIDEQKKSLRTWRYISKNVFPNSLMSPIEDLKEALTGIYHINRYEVNTVDYPRTIKIWRERLHQIKNNLSPALYENYDTYFKMSIEYNEGRLALSRFSLSPIR